MEKFSGAKTIGDGTYGSVLKAINKQNGKGPLTFPFDYSVSFKF